MADLNASDSIATLPGNPGQRDTKVRILLVEDETDLRLLYAEVLSQAGFHVDMAVDGETASKKILEGKWDLLYLDIMLPKKDGLKILKEIKATPALKKGPIVIISGLNNETAVKEAYANGADDYLVKSDIDPDFLVKEANRLLGISGV